MNVKNEHKGNITPEKLKELKKTILESLSIDRHMLICCFPFTGAISMRLDLIPVRDKRIRTACTDGKSIYFDCDFYSKLNEHERQFVLAHEIWHCVMLHFSRRQNRDFELFNIATDMEVNYLLATEASNNRARITAPDSVLFPPKNLEGKSAEVIYDYLIKEQQKNNGNIPKSCFGKNPFSNSSKNKVDNINDQFDKHTYIDDDNDSDVEQKITDQWGEVGYDSDFTPSVSKDIADKIRETVTSVAQQYQRTTGGLPGTISDIINKIMKPEINWKEELCNFVTTVYGDGRSWLPPNRRHVYNDLYFQSRRTTTLKIAVAVDTSGSCVNDLPKFFGELNGLLNSFGNYQLTLIQNDYAISSVDYYDNDNPFIPEQIKWKGGGGTSFKPPFEWIKENNPDIDCFVYFTDSYEGFYDDEHCINQNYPEPSYPVLWVLTKDGNKDFCPWGKKIQFKESSYNY